MPKMDFTVILIFVVLSAITALMMIFVFRRRSAPGLEDASSDYAEGLNSLLAGDTEKALKKFKEAVTKNSQNIDAYLKIGDILRESGQFDRAVNVHKYLTVRTTLTAKQKREIYQSLVMDYQAAQEYDKAFDVLGKIISEDKNNTWAHEMKLKLYEQKEEWEDAFQVYKNLKKISKEFKNGRLALYKVQEGLKLSKNGKEKDAQARFRDAIKIDSQSPPAYIYLADSYRNEDRKEDALKVLKQFVEKVPSQSFLAFELIKELLYEGGVYGEIENFYLEIINSQPDNHEAKLALAENYKKKGEIEKAVNLCSSILESDPSNKAAKQYLIRLYHHTGQKDEALNLAIELIEASSKHKEKFRCSKCRHESDKPFWRCPGCFEWETAIQN